MIGLSSTDDGQWLTTSIGLLFSSLHHNADIWKYNIPAKQAIHLTKGSNSNNMFPRFTRDGKHIIFRSGRSGVAYASERGGLKEETPLIPIFSPQPYGDVYLMSLSDKKIIAVTDNKWEDSLPNWKDTKRPSTSR